MAFVKSQRNSKKAFDLLQKRQSAFCLLWLIAQRAKRFTSSNETDPLYAALNMGEAVIDCRSCGSTERTYRTDKQYLTSKGFISCRIIRVGKNYFCVAKLLDNDIFDININEKVTGQNQTKNEKSDRPSDRPSDEIKEYIDKENITADAVVGLIKSKSDEPLSLGQILIRKLGLQTQDQKQNYKWQAEANRFSSMFELDLNGFFIKKGKKYQICDSWFRLFRDKSQQIIPRLEAAYSYFADDPNWKGKSNETKFLFLTDIAHNGLTAFKTKGREKLKNKV